MRIACLGWGSLVWHPRNLDCQKNWYTDGPFLPIEFLRTSKDGRLTLVLSKEHGFIVRVLWTLMNSEELDYAIESLRRREEIPEKNKDKDIGSILLDEPTSNSICKTIQSWMQPLGIDAAIWSNLPPKFKEQQRPPYNDDEILDYFFELDKESLKKSEQYVRRAPKQIDTPYRRLLEKELGWSYEEE